MINLIKRLTSRIGRLFLADLYSRLNTLEYRSFNRRFYAVEQCAEYLVSAGLDGDYLEFGVYQGATFSHAFQWISPHFKDMKFWAFDSFEGLPKPQGLDSANGYAGNFHEKEFSCSKEEFTRSIHAKGVDLGKVTMVKGWFSETLTPQHAQEYAIKRIAMAWIDCDLYESTVPVLDFITPYLVVGTVIVFDDWRCFRNHPDFGEQRACREWLETNKQIQLAELFSYGCCGMVFTVRSC
ncbi:MAG: class I SAM-dependent methyltransferase [Propionivibrio sp.]|uniref:Class I SAM-dependent methyltransferase n=1 Tax=Candidatus Propionivibrio dominans TaxID=2954373 RepID=A0A9D7IBM2_9RHOO|nr:class I SAM-dependent methyltransferase [Candidatus Propionivibrio dominans]